MDAISCLAAPSFADAALARALHFSVMSSSSSSSANQHHHNCQCSSPSSLMLCADQLAYAPPVTSDAVLVAADYSHSPRRSSAPAAGVAGRRLAPAGARAGKRRSRASKRAPTTYISTDPSNFRLMVQQVTGVQAEPSQLGDVDPAAAFDAASLLLAADTSNPLMVTAAEDQHHHRNEPCFPTLDSWSVVSMHERND